MVLEMRRMKTSPSCGDPLLRRTTKDPRVGSSRRSKDLKAGLRDDLSYVDYFSG